jgi:hypothetical protein
MPSALRCEVVPRHSRGSGIAFADTDTDTDTDPAPADVPQVPGRAGARRMSVAHLVEVESGTLPTH